MLNDPVNWIDPFGLDMRNINPFPAGPLGPIITFTNDFLPGQSPDQPVTEEFAEMIEDAVTELGADVNINSTTGGIHGKNSRHYTGQGADINCIGGSAINEDNPLAEKLQTILQNHSNTRENYGPFINEKYNRTTKIPYLPSITPKPRQASGHRTHIHITGQR